MPKLPADPYDSSKDKRIIIHRSVLENQFVRLQTLLFLHKTHFNNSDQSRCQTKNNILMMSLDQQIHRILIKVNTKRQMSIFGSVSRKGTLANLVTTGKIGERGCAADEDEAIWLA